MKKSLSYSIGAAAVLVISVIAFVLPSSLGRSAKQNEIVFGKYDGKEIKYGQNSEFNDNLSYWYNYFQRMGYPMDSNTQYMIYTYAFNSTVNEFANTAKVEKTGYLPGNETVNRIMRQQFVDENGKFSKKMYNEAPAEFVDEIKKSVKKSIMQNRFQEDNYGSSDKIQNKTLYGLKSADNEWDFIAAMDTNKRGFQMAAFKKSEYPEEEMIAFGKNNAAKFVKYDMSILTYNSENEAKEMANGLAANTVSYEDALAASTKIYSDTEGKITNAYMYQLENILENKADLSTIVDLSVDSYSTVIKTNSGYSIFKQNAACVQPDFESDEIKSRISTYINSYESGIIEDYYLAKANEFKAEAANNFEAACDKYGIELVEIEPFPMNYGSIPVATSVNTALTGLKGADENENFLATAFSLAMNEVSAPIVNDDYVVVLKYTQSETADADEDIQAKAESEIKNMDMVSGQNVYMNSKKFENNFSKVYFSNFMSY